MTDIAAIKRRAEAVRDSGCIFTPEHYIRVMTQDIPALLTALSAAEAKVRELEAALADTVAAVIGL